MKPGNLVKAFVLAVMFVGATVTTERVVALQMFADTRAIVEFHRATDSYAFVHRQAERRITMAHRKANDPLDIRAGELAKAIVAERAQARGMNFFTPAVVAVFRELAASAVHGGCDAGELRTGVWELSHEVNSPATGSKPIATCIAKVLPDLPDELEYRSAGTVLLLVDHHANLVVDVLPALLAGSEIR
jgi:hypothetical protein